MKIQIPDRYIFDGLITKRKHPTLDLYIYNYTRKTQYGGLWDDITSMCRGLIVNEQGNVVGRPLPKFFNLGEQDEGIDYDEPVTITEKMDGSLGILYQYYNNIGIATRGSFDGEQACEANALLIPYLRDGFCPLSSHTYLFEIIYPENKIVVDYKGLRDLVFITAVNIEDGSEIGAEQAGWGGPCVKQAPYKTVNEMVRAPQQSNAEGFVVRAANGTRVKYKYDEYIQLHRALAYCKEKHVYDMLICNPNLLEKLRYLDKIDEMIGDLKQHFTDVYDVAHTLYINALKNSATRKDFALFVNRHEYKHIAFAMLDRKDVTKMVWHTVGKLRGLL